jgi:serine/threonine protein kinase
MSAPEPPAREWSTDDYAVQKLIGEGSYGRALLCKEKASGRLIVVKEVSFANLTPKEQEDARRETTFLSKLNHVTIVG